MSIRLTLLWGALIIFGSYSTWVMWNIGYFGIWQAGFTSSGALQILLDLVIGVFLICCWIKKDAESRNRSPYPWMAGALLTGTIAPLIYLIAREYDKHREAATVPQ